jgi:hypothetical protein
VAELSREDLRRLARLGAAARLEELRREEAAIRQSFPELFHPATRPVARRSKAAETAAPAPRRNHMSAAARKAVSERMKKYWAGRRKAKGKG